MLLWPAIAEGLLLFCWLDAASMIPAWVVCAAVVLMQLLSCWCLEDSFFLLICCLFYLLCAMVCWMPSCCHILFQLLTEVPMSNSCCYWPVAADDCCCSCVSGCAGTAFRTCAPAVSSGVALEPVVYNVLKSCHAAVWVVELGFQLLWLAVLVYWSYILCSLVWVWLMGEAGLLVCCLLMLLNTFMLLLSSYKCCRLMMLI